MKTDIYNNIQQDFVEEMRKIRDEISYEIKDMTFEQERAYLDKLLEQQIQSTAYNVVIIASGGVEKQKN